MKFATLPAKENAPASPAESIDRALEGLKAVGAHLESAVRQLRAEAPVVGTARRADIDALVGGLEAARFGILEQGARLPALRAQALAR